MSNDGNNSGFEHGARNATITVDRNLLDFRKTFLLSAISDIQGTVSKQDSKAQIILAVFGLFLSQFVGKVNGILSMPKEERNLWSMLVVIIALVMMIATIVAAILVLRCKSFNNKDKTIRITDSNKYGNDSLWYYQIENYYSLDKYVSKFENTNEETLMLDLEKQVYILNCLRAKKSKALKVMTVCFCVFVLAFLVLMFF